jgi:hypothetical protein
LAIVRAFGRSGSKQEREQALERAERLNLVHPTEPEPPAAWVGLLLVGAAILVASCCTQTDTTCDSEDDTDNGDTDDDK